MAAQRSKAARSAVGKTGRPMAAIGVTPVRTPVTRGKRTSMVWQWALILKTNSDTSYPEVYDNKGAVKGAVVGLINSLLENGHDVEARWDDQTGSTQRVVYSVNAEGQSIVVEEERIAGRIDVDGNPLPGPRCIDLPWSAKSGQPGNESLVRRRKALAGAPDAERAEREAEREAAREAKRKAKGEPKPKTKRTPKVPEPKEPAPPKAERAPRTPRTPREPAAPKAERAPRTPRTPRTAPVVAPPPPPPPAPPRATRRDPAAPRTPRGPKTPRVEQPPADRASQVAGIQNDFMTMLQGLAPKPGASHTGRPNPYRYGGR